MTPGDDSQAPQKEIWANGAAYEAYVGRWSRLVAIEFLDWLNVPAKSHWLDVGCGTGAFSQTILDSAAPGSVTGIDRSEGYVAFARKYVQDERVRFEVGDAQALRQSKQASTMQLHRAWFSTLSRSLFER